MSALEVTPVTFFLMKRSLTQPHMTLHKGILCRIKLRVGAIRATDRNNQGLEPLMQMYIPSTSELKVDIVNAVHKRTAGE